MDTRSNSAIPRKHVLLILRNHGFITDVEGRDLTVLRNRNFPFQRLSLPKDESISVELLKLYAEDSGIPIKQFLNFTDE